MMFGGAGSRDVSEMLEAQDRPTVPCPEPEMTDEEARAVALSTFRGPGPECAMSGEWLGEIQEMCDVDYL